MPHSAHPSLEQLLALETGVWEAFVNGDADADAALLTDDFIGISHAGVTDKAGHVAPLREGPAAASYQLDDIRLGWAAADAGLICYRANWRRPGHDQSEVMYISSLWVRRNGGWRNVFSQDTPQQA